jgi:hypothetical protein
MPLAPAAVTLPEALNVIEEPSMISPLIVLLLSGSRLLISMLGGLNTKPCLLAVAR